MKNILSQEIKIYRTELEQIVKSLHELTINIGHEEWKRLVSDLRTRIDEPFMFVIVGEVKSGKSSFINALLESKKEICKVAAHPMTDTIQQIVYGEEERIVSINEFQKKIYQPVDILREIAIVDTPGTNAIIAHHQEITEQFVPASDLIVFVFEAKNPYRQSAWDFFNFITQEWRKKVIFILQQKDLMNAEDLNTNLKGVREFAEKKGMQEAKIFAVSAKEELEGASDSSGFSAVRSFITENITGGRAPYLKLKNNIQTSLQVLSKIDDALTIREAQFQADKKFRDEIRDTLNNQKAKSNNQVDILVENLLASYDRVTSKNEKELNHGISFFPMLKRSIRSIFN